MSGICVWGIQLGADKKVTDTVDQFIHMRLFLVVNILLLTYSVVIYLPTKIYQLRVGI